MTIKLTVSAKKSDPKVNYIPFKNNHPFIQQNHIEEVMERKIGKLNKVGIYASTFGIGMIPQIAFASTQVGEMISPHVVFQYALKLALIGLGVSVGMAMLLLLANGIMKMMFPKQKKKQKEWTTDIYKGFVHCLVTIPTVLALYLLATAVFGNFDFSKVTFLNSP